MRRRLIRGAAAVALVAGSLVVGGPLTAHGAAFVVNTNGDGAGACPDPSSTLRGCIAAANLAGGTNTISFSSSVTSPIVLSGTELHITNAPAQTLTITGLGQATTVIDANASSRVFEVDSGATVIMTDLTVENGAFTSSSGFEGGGGIRNAGTLTLDRVTVTGNQALAAAGVAATSGGIRDVTNALLTIRHSLFSNNTAISDTDAAGGAIQDCCISGSMVNITDSVFSGNSATTTTGQSFGGALAAHGTWSIARTAFNDNFTTQTAFGAGNNTGSGAIVSHGTLTVDASTFHHNTSTATFSFASAGAIDICCGGAPTLTVTNSSFDHNGTTGANGADAGAIEICCGASGSITGSTFDSNTTSGPGAFGGAVTVDTRSTATSIPVVNSTFTGNTASGTGANGGGISLPQTRIGAVPVRLTNDTIDKNTAPTGADIFAGTGQTLRMQNTIVAGAATNNCVVSGATVTDLGNNLEDASVSTCGFSTANADILGLDPRLGTLGNNGGPTSTQALLAGSPAIDKASNAGCPATDQRGITRISTTDPVCDIGAFEFVPAPVTPILPKAGAAQREGSPNSVPSAIAAVVMLLALFGLGAFTLVSKRRLPER